MAQYSWKPDGPAPDIDAQVLGEILEEIAGDASCAPPKALLDYARPARSPVHHIFKWNDAEAGELYRIEQARGFIRALQIVRVEVTPGQTISNRAFFSVQLDKRGYVPQDRILHDTDLRKQVLEDARKELESFIRRWGGIMALGTVVPRLQQIVEEMKETNDTVAFKAARRPAKARGGGEEETAGVGA